MDKLKIKALHEFDLVAYTKQLGKVVGWSEDETTRRTLEAQNEVLYHKTRIELIKELTYAR